MSSILIGTLLALLAGACGLLLYLLRRLELAHGDTVHAVAAAASSAGAQHALHLEDLRAERQRLEARVAELEQLHARVLAAEGGVAAPTRRPPGVVELPVEGSDLELGPAVEAALAGFGEENDRVEFREAALAYRTANPRASDDEIVAEILGVGALEGEE